MPNQQFFDLMDEKQEKIIHAAMREFYDHGYENGSTNRIVKAAAIAKGSLFKYFQSKENLYFFLIDRVVEALIQAMPVFSDGPFEKIKAYAEYEFDFYQQHPLDYRFVKRAFFEESEAVKKMLYKCYEEVSNDFFIGLFNPSELDTERKRAVIDILKWVLKGLNDDFMRNHNLENTDEAKKQYLRKLEQYLSILNPLKEVFDENNQ